MEKNSNNLVNFSDIPPEIQQKIASYLDAPGLCFFGMSDKKTLKNILPLLHHYQVQFPLRLTAGRQHTYLAQAHSLFMCGFNMRHQHGLGDRKKKPTTFTAVPWPAKQGTIQQVIAGEHYSLVLTDDHRLWGRGYYYLGQLGLRGNENRNTFTEVKWPKEQGKIQQIIVRDSYTLVLTDDHRLWGCGHSLFGQLGFGDNKKSDIFTEVEWPKEQGKIQQIIAGDCHTLVLTEDHRLWGCGRNKWGQLGLGDNEDRNTFTEVKWPVERGTIAQVSACGSHTFVLTDEHRLWGCGNNCSGQLGLGDKRNRTFFTEVKWPAERGTIQQIIAGSFHTLVLTEDYRLWGCGANFYRQLGVGGKKNHLTFIAMPWSVKYGPILQATAGQCHTAVLTTTYRLGRCGFDRHSTLELGGAVYLSKFTLETVLPRELQQILTFNNTLSQLLKLGTALMLLSDTQSNTLNAKHQPDKSEIQPLLKKQSCNFQ